MVEQVDVSQWVRTGLPTLCLLRWGIPPCPRGDSSARQGGLARREVPARLGKDPISVPGTRSEKRTLPQGRWTHQGVFDQSLPNTASPEPSSHNQEPGVPLGVEHRRPLISTGHCLPR